MYIWSQNLKQISLHIELSIQTGSYVLPICRFLHEHWTPALQHNFITGGSRHILGSSPFKINFTKAGQLSTYQTCQSATWDRMWRRWHWNSWLVSTSHIRTQCATTVHTLFWRGTLTFIFPFYRTFSTTTLLLYGTALNSIRTLDQMFCVQPTYSLGRWGLWNR